jgi:hypothetical protein
MFSLFILRMIMHFNKVQVKKMECVYNIKYMGCSCSLCNHEYVTDCEGAYCECCSESEHIIDSLIANEDELLDILETKYPLMMS